MFDKDPCLFKLLLVVGNIPFLNLCLLAYPKVCVQPAVIAQFIILLMRAVIMCWLMNSLQSRYGLLIAQGSTIPSFVLGVVTGNTSKFSISMVYKTQTLP